MADKKVPGLLDPVRERVRRGQLIIGLGFVAYILGGILASSVMFRLQNRIGGVVAASLIQQMWLYTTLPALFYVAARFIDLRPWSSAVGGVVTGEIFRLMLDYISTGWEWLHRGAFALVLRLGLVAVGVVFTAYVVRLGRAQAQSTEAAAKDAAEKKKQEYSAFADEAKRLAEAEKQPTPPPSSSS